MCGRHPGGCSILACVWVVKLLQSCQWCPARAVMHKIHLQKYPQVSAQFEKVCAGDREAAQELTGRGKEHAYLAKEARQRANQAAYDSCNMSVTNRFKVRSCTPWHKANDDHSGILQFCFAVCPLDMLKLDMSRGVLLSQVDLHGLHVEEALQVLEQHLLSLGGLGCPGGVLLQVRQMHLPGTLSMMNLHILNSCVVATLVPGSFCNMAFWLIRCPCRSSPALASIAPMAVPRSCQQSSAT